MDDERARRLTKVETLRQRGTDPYPVRFDRTHTIADLAATWASLANGDEAPDGSDVRVAGRILRLREQGRVSFADIRDATGTIQLYVPLQTVGEADLADFNDLDLGDWVGVQGVPMRTRRGELSVKVTSFVLLAKSLRPLPDKWHGLADIDTRFRQRYVDLIVNEDARRVFDIRFAAVAAVREFLRGRGFVEVETPVLHEVAGGAAARPFVTYHRALDRELNLRIALELPLKRLLVAGFDKVFEIGRVFRNEGLSTRHQPEFTMLELYEAFVDYHDMMALTEELVGTVALDAIGTTTIRVADQTIELAPPWERRTMVDLVREHAGVEVHPGMAVEKLQRTCDDLGVPYDQGWAPGKLVMEIYEKTTEPNLIGPVFVLDYPREVSPLARVHRDDPQLTERFEPVVLGREIGNAFSELNDPVDQRSRFEDQAALRREGDPEASEIDEDYVRALEYGLPPCGGLGIGIDRLVMLLAGVTSIREVILFPHLRPE